MTTQVRPVDPPQLHQSPAFAQGMIVPAGPTLYVGGQTERTVRAHCSTDSDRRRSRPSATCWPCSPRRERDPEHVAELTIYLATGIDPGAAYAATGSVWGNRRTAVTVLAVTQPVRAPWSKSRPWPQFPITEANLATAVGLFERRVRR